MPQDKRREELFTLAREFTRRAAWATETAEGWLAELMTRLRTGMGGDKYRALFRSGRELCRMCQSVTEIAGYLWRMTEAVSVPVAEIRDAEGTLSAARQRLTAVENEIASLTRRAGRHFPEMDLERLEKEKQQIAERKVLTPEQSRAAFLKPE
ncbi:hypothetical protein J8F10_07440 [Gemmata sp. G18]|uniref:Uncharacterized protein n=1 Tax=Gemmata palustris TaxID=2822762 RepID=A0ABS5BN50_9BACT|nr:hypothetical protein [Gemmata palustris]MBP3955112.1 hypothetical protein [Gemmata palustris]